MAIDGILANQFIVAEVISETFDDILTAIPFDVDRPTGVLAVQEILSSIQRAFGWIGISNIFILERRARCNREY